MTVARAKLLGSGLALAGAYVAVALATLHPGLPLRPLFDGNHGPGPAYRYVTPPTPDPAALPPLPGEATIPVVERKQDGERIRVVQGGLVTTGDGQASLQVPGVAIETPGRRDRRTHFSLTPLDPATVGDPPPGTEFDGNALEVVGTYEPSGKPVRFAEQDCTLGGCVTVIVRYAHAGTRLWRQDGDAWTEVDEVKQFPGLTLAAPVDHLGIFAVTREPGTGPTATAAESNTTLYAALGAGGVAVAAALALQWRRRANDAGSKRASSAKGAARKSAAPKRGKSATRGRSRR